MEGTTGRVKMVHHPDEVWMRHSYSDQEPWKKIVIEGHAKRCTFIAHVPTSHSSKSCQNLRPERHGA